MSLISTSLCLPFNASCFFFVHFFARPSFDTASFSFGLLRIHPSTSFAAKKIQKQKTMDWIDLVFGILLMSMVSRITIIEITSKQVSTLAI